MTNTDQPEGWRKRLSPEEEAALRRSGQSLADRAAASTPGAYKPGDDLEQRQDQLLDEAVEETFPASDPISPKAHHEIGPKHFPPISGSAMGRPSRPG